MANNYMLSLACTICVFHLSITSSQNSGLNFKGKLNNSSFRTTAKRNAENDVVAQTADESTAVDDDDCKCEDDVRSTTESGPMKSSGQGDDECQIHAYETKQFDNSPCDADSYYHSTWTRSCATNDSGCYCNEDAAVCCGQNLTSVPAFNTTIRYLNITGNNLIRLDDKTLENVPNLEVLVIYQNNISYVTEDAFKNTRNLTHLEITFNNGTIDATNFTASVNELNLTVLALNGTKFSAISKGSEKQVYIGEVIRNLTLHKLQVLYVDIGQDKTLYFGDLAHLKSLCIFSMRQHLLTHVDCCSASRDCNDLGDHSTIQDNDRCTNSTCSFVLRTLQVLELGDNHFMEVPNFCCPTNKSISIVPMLWRLAMPLNGLIEPDASQFKCLPNVTSLDLAGNPLRRLRKCLFACLPNLVVLDMRFTNVISTEAEVFKHKKLQGVTIKSSNWFFDNDHISRISEDLFQGSNFIYVDLSYNVFAYTKENKTNKIFAPLQQVQYLHVEDVGFRQIPEIITQNFTKLKKLYLKANLITNYSSILKLKNRGLKYLDLSWNFLSTIDKGVIESFLLGGTQINMAMNPFTCTCDILWFMEVFKACGNISGRHFNENACRNLIGNGTQRVTGSFVRTDDYYYLCASPTYRQGVKLENLHMTQQQCLLSLQQELIIFFFTGTAIMSLLVAIFLYRYRWQVRYMLYVIHVRWKRQHAIGPQRHVRFTAFVSYCKQDTNFVIKKVLPTLEKGPRLPLCIHERDFTAGRYLSDNILQHMQHSQHVLLLLSNAFLQDEWCRFELYVAQRYGQVHLHIPITIIKLEPLSLELMDVNVVTLLHTAPLLDWPGLDSDPQVKDLFWRRLNRTLGGSTPSTVRRRQLRSC